MARSVLILAVWARSALILNGILLDSLGTYKGAETSSHADAIPTAEEFIATMVDRLRASSNSHTPREFRRVPNRYAVTQDGSEPRPPGVTAAGVVDELWGGEDFNASTMDFDDLARRTYKTSERNVQVLGLQGAGTDLLHAMLYLNFGTSLNYHSLPTNSSNYVHGVSTYVNLKAKWEVEQDWMEDLSGSQLYGIIVVRNPFSWLRKIRGSPPAAFERCLVRKDWLTENCTHPYPAGPQSPLGPKDYENLMTLWGSWIDGYLHADEYGFPNNMIVTYEDMVNSPDVVMGQIALFLGLDTPSTIVKPDSPDHHGQSTASTYINSGHYMDMFGPAALATLCSSIDSHLLSSFDYSDCNSSTPGLSAFSDIGL